ncbi:MAG: hypothetical protein CMJ58_28100 [Planctomycetaceae bacterium]|nr:hypothetical protein [Planctomycetaceae bacterium]
MSPGPAAQRPAQGPQAGLGPGDTPRNGEGKEGSRGTLGPDGSPENAAGEDAVAELPLFDRGVSSNTPPSKTNLTTGGEDWLELSLYLAHESFGHTSQILDQARDAAEKGNQGEDELILAGERFIVQSGHATTGKGRKRIAYRWRLVGESGLVLLLMNRGKVHKTLPNGIARATSLQLMRDGADDVYRLVLRVLAALNIRLVREKLTRVDAAADLPGVDVETLSRPYREGRFVARARKNGDHVTELCHGEHRFGRRSTGFDVGAGDIRMRIYDKVLEVLLDYDKIEALVARRWGDWPKCATRVEIQLRREALKRLGVDSWADWRSKRGRILAELTANWFRLVEETIDPKHANRAATLPAWNAVRAAFESWAGNEPAELEPLPTTAARPEHLIKQAVGVLVSALARMDRPVDSNEDFIHEGMSILLDEAETKGLATDEFTDAAFEAIRKEVVDRDMAKEVSRRTVELGIGRRTGRPRKEVNHE